MKQDSPIASRSRRRTMLRPLLIFAILAGAVIAAWQLMLPVSVTVTSPMRAPAIQAVYATGTVEASVTIRVAPQAAGRILELKVDEGSTVKAGDVLARLDDNDLRAAVAELEARAKYAEQQLERTGSLLKQGWATQEKFDQSRSEVDAVRQAARRMTEQMAFMSLRTPADGKVIRRDGEAGDYIPINQPVFYIAKEGAPLRISADVDEEDIPLVKLGQKVLIRSDAFPARVFTGEVKDITPKGDPVARNYRVRILLPADTALMIGMTAETNIVTREKQDALLIPASAVSGSALWVVRDGKLVNIPVQTGIKGRDRVEIAAGLPDADLVVIDPSQRLKAGETVRVRQQNQPSLTLPVQGTAR
jgi:RND family efflux transporter MFP subunit